MRLQIALAAMLVSTAAFAADRPTIPNSLRAILMPGQVRDLSLKQADRIWDNDTRSAKEITLEDAETFRQILEASMRAQRLTIVLRADLDGDGLVSREEYDNFQKFKARAYLPYPGGDGRQGDIFAVYDANGDGKISVDEILRYKDANLAQQQNPYGNRIKDLLALDPNKDGRLTKEEFLAAVAAAFDAVDTDKNAVLDVKEIGAASGQSLSIE